LFATTTIMTKPGSADDLRWNRVLTAQHPGTNPSCSLPRWRASHRVGAADRRERD
jgi:hypothetical protein